MVLEALAKHVLACDQGGVDIQSGRRIRVENYAAGADSAKKDFRFGVF